jgi:hypothetical protein
MGWRGEGLGGLQMKASVDLKRSVNVNALISENHYAIARLLLIKTEDYD